MKYNKLKLIYFSPVGTTKQTLENIAEGCGVSDVEKINITDFDIRWKPAEFGPDELVFIGVPSYSGRVPAPVALYFNTVRSTGSACVPIVVYGNRAYDDTLLELKTLTEVSGFRNVAAAAFIAEHSLCAAVAEGRPDAEDIAEQADFGRGIMEKLNNPDETEQPLTVPGKFPHRIGMDLPYSPEADDNCTLCGDCVTVCPVKAIDHMKPSRTDAIRCIFCGACIKVCPVSARKMTHPRLKSLENKIAGIGNERKKAEIFI